MSDGSRRFFPYEKPYDHQAEAMERIREALVEERDVLFEGACGTGKTFVVMTAVLPAARAYSRAGVSEASVLPVPQAPSKRTSRSSTSASRMRSIASAWWSYGSS